MRKATVVRDTKETKIQIDLTLEGGAVDIKTGSGFFDHMLTLFASHGNFGLIVKCAGDVDVDFHHSVEDIGIVLGEAFKQALGDKVGINRYGDIILPMDEALVLVALDIGGRSYLNYNVPLKASRLNDDGDEQNPKVGFFDCELIEEFFLAFTRSLGANVHIKELDGKNTHHILEAVFKGFGRAMKKACEITGTALPSTKGVL